MPIIQSLIETIEQFAHPQLQESYDNAGLIVGDSAVDATGVLVALDTTEEVVDEAIRMNCNLVVTHHPIIFQGIKRITNQSAQGRILAKAIRNNIVLYACHTNLDSVPDGVSGRMADVFGLINRRVLIPKEGVLVKLVCFIPTDYLTMVQDAIFAAGAGHIGNYDSCSYYGSGTGTFRGEEGSQPFVGQAGQFHQENEIKLETIVPKMHLSRVIKALLKAHPYEEVAYDIYPLNNRWEGAGLGIVGDLPEEMQTQEILELIKSRFNLPTVRHTRQRVRPVKKLALCGGSGGSFIGDAKRSGADIYITGDLKYHDFFEADGDFMLIDAGHFETEQFAVGLLGDLLMKNFPKFAVHLSKVITNPINYT